jgi:hypothetical protein
MRHVNVVVLTIVFLQARQPTLPDEALFGPPAGVGTSGLSR